MLKELDQPLPPCLLNLKVDCHDGCLLSGVAQQRVEEQAQNLGIPVDEYIQMLRTSDLITQIDWRISNKKLLEADTKNTLTCYKGNRTISLPRVGFDE